MCGFFGELTNELLDEPTFSKILSRSFKRGPDQHKVWKTGNIYQVGFNRLSILDLSERGSQPLLSPSGRFSLVINGEVYNYRVLSQKFRIPESSLRSTSDSEVIAHLLDLLPLNELVNELNGMFAIAVYDCELKKLSLIRDFAGIKPLFYGMNGDTVVFASQFDQVFTHPAIQKNLQVDHGGLYDYSALGYMPGMNTVFKNIFQCRPGELVEFEVQGKARHLRFCTFQNNPAGRLDESASSTVELLDEILNNVVSDQLVADVPVGVFLSGGIDSPLIASHAKKHKSDITAFTIGVSDHRMDESEKATEYAKALNLKHEIIRFGESELLQYNDEHFKSLSVPFGDYSSLPTYLVTRKAREHNTVMLSGDGGDELFWGYPRFLNVVNHFNWFDYPKLFRKHGSGILRKTGRRISYGVSDFDQVEHWILSQQCHNSPSLLSKLLPNLTFSKQLLDDYTPSQKLKNKNELLQWLRWNEFYGHLQRVLTKVDLASMGNSLEVRVPFLDKRVIDFAWQIIPGLGISHQTPKMLLKNSLRQRVNHSMINNSKKGFTVPVRKWLQKELRQDLQHHLLDIPLFGNEFWNKKELEQRLKLFIEEDKGNEWGIWILYSMQKWAARYQLV